MTDMTKFTGKKEFPSQTENRRVWILDTVRANQLFVSDILALLLMGSNDDAKGKLDLMHKSDRDALLQSGGILSDEQIELLK